MSGQPAVRVGVLGAGLMGHGIAQVFSQAGFAVTIWDPDAQALNDVPRKIDAHLQQLGEPRRASVRLCTTLAECVQGCDLVVEAAPEQLALKQELVRQIDAANPDCIVASNTSVLRITEIALHATNPRRVVGTHWWNPPYLIPVVEVVRGEHTGADVADQVTHWLRAAGKLPVDVFKDAPGFVGNRMQFALVREAAHIVAQGICSAETVDLVARHTFGRRMAAVGPLRNSDYIGLDLVEAIIDYLAPHLCDVPQTPALIKQLVAAGDKGAKTGQGIFPWREGEREQTEQRLLQHLAAMQSLDASR